MAVSVGEIEAILKLKDEMSSKLREANGVLKQFGSDSTSVTDKLSNFSSKATAVGASLSIGITAPLVAATTASLMASSGFETAMIRLQTLAGVSASDLEKVKKHILDLAPAVGIGPDALAAAMTKVSSTVSDTTVAMNILDIAAKGSAAGLGQAVDVAGALTSVINSYGAENITAARAGDILTQAIKDGGAEAKELAPTLANVVPFASAMGVSFEEVAANIATMTKLGTPAAEAVTSLSSVLSAMNKPSKEGEEALGRVGLTFATLRAEIKEKGLAATLTDLKNRFGDNTEELIKVFGRIEAFRNMLGTAGSQAETYAQVLNNMGKASEAAGVLQGAFTEITKTTSFKVANASAQVQVLAIKLGDSLAPVFKEVITALVPLLDYLDKGIKAFNELDPSTKKWVLALLGIVAAIGPVLLVLGSLSSSLSAIIAIAPFIVSAGTAIGSAATIMLGPWGLVAAAVVAAGVVFYEFNKSLDDTVRRQELAANGGHTLTDEQKKLNEAIKQTKNSSIDYNKTITINNDGLQAYRTAAQLAADAIKDKAAADLKATVVARGQALATEEQIKATKEQAEAHKRLTELLKATPENIAKINVKQRESIEVYLKLGASIEDLAKEYPKLTKAQIEGIDKAMKARQEQSDELNKLLSEEFTALEKQLAKNELEEKSHAAALLSAQRSAKDAEIAINGDLLGSKMQMLRLRHEAEIAAAEKELNGTEHLAGTLIAINEKYTAEQITVLATLKNEAALADLTRYMNAEEAKIAVLEDGLAKELAALTDANGKKVDNYEQASTLLIEQEHRKAKEILDSAVKLSQLEQDASTLKTRGQIIDVKALEAASVKSHKAIEDKAQQTYFYALEHANDYTKEGIANFKKIADETAKTTKETKGYGEAIGELSSLFVELGQITGGTLSSIFTGLGKTVTMLKASSAAAKESGGHLGFLSKALDENASSSDRLQGAIMAVGAVAEGVSSVMKATSEHATRAGNAVGGMMAGMQAGAAFGPIGMAIGAAAGLVAGLIRGVPQWARAATEVARDFGVKISDELAHAIAESAKNDFNGDRATANLMALSSIVASAGGLVASNLDRLREKFKDGLESIASEIEKVVYVYSDVFDEFGNVTATLETSYTNSAAGIARGNKFLEENFASFAKASTSSIGLLDKAMVDLMKKADELQLSSASMTAYIVSQLKSAGEGLSSSIMISGDALRSYDELKKKHDDLAAAGRATNELMVDGIKVMTGLSLNEYRRLYDLGKLYDATRIKSQQSADAIGGSIAGIIQANVRAGMSFVDAVRAAAPMVTSFREQLTNTGFSGGAAFGYIEAQVKLVTNAVAGPALQSISGYTSALIAMSNAGILDQDTFKGLTAQIAETANALMRQGFSGKLILGAMQRDLQAVWEMQTKFGYSVDDSTQALIDQGLKSGLIGAQYKETNEKILDVLIAIGEVLGATIPAALKAVKGSFDALEDTSEKTTDAIDEGMYKFGRTGLDSVNQIEDAIAAMKGPDLKAISESVLRVIPKIDAVGVESLRSAMIELTTAGVPAARLLEVFGTDLREMQDAFIKNNQTVPSFITNMLSLGNNIADTTSKLADARANYDSISKELSAAQNDLAAAIVRRGEIVKNAAEDLIAANLLAERQFRTTGFAKAIEDANSSISESRNNIKTWRGTIEDSSVSISDLRQRIVKNSESLEDAAHWQQVYNDVVEGGVDRLRSIQGKRISIENEIEALEVSNLKESLNNTIKYSLDEKQVEQAKLQLAALERSITLRESQEHINRLATLRQNLRDVIEQEQNQIQANLNAIVAIQDRIVNEKRLLDSQITVDKAHISSIQQMIAAEELNITSKLALIQQSKNEIAAIDAQIAKDKQLQDARKSDLAAIDAVILALQGRIGTLAQAKQNAAEAVMFFEDSLKKLKTSLDDFMKDLSSSVQAAAKAAEAASLAASAAAKAAEAAAFAAKIAAAGPITSPETKPSTTQIVRRDLTTSQFATPTSLDGLQALRLSGMPVYLAQGTDTVPAMLTPGEAVLTTGATNVLGRNNINRLNSGQGITSDEVIAELRLLRKQQSASNKQLPLLVALAVRDAMQLQTKR